MKNLCPFTPAGSCMKHCHWWVGQRFHHHHHHQHHHEENLNGPRGNDEPAELFRATARLSFSIFSTSAHQHISTSAHQHISTSAHQHISHWPRGANMYSEPSHPWQAHPTTPLMKPLSPHRWAARAFGNPPYLFCKWCTEYLTWVKSSLNHKPLGSTRDKQKTSGSEIP